MYFSLNLELVYCSMSVLTVASWHAYKISQKAGKVVWYSHLFKNFPLFAVIHTVKGFVIVKKVVDVFLVLSCFSNDPTDFGNLIFGSSAFSKSSLNVWKFSVHILLKPSLENVDHYYASMWDECNYVVWVPIFSTLTRTSLYACLVKTKVLTTFWNLSMNLLFYFTLIISDI